MLRRKPTAITLTSEDISSYEDRSAAAAQAAAQELAQAQAQAAAAAQAEAGFRTPGQQQPTPQRGQNRADGAGGMAPPVREKTRDERLGLGIGMGMGPRGGNSGRS